MLTEEEPIIPWNFPILLPPGVVNIVNGFGFEAGKPLASSSRIAKIVFTGETATGRLIMQYASQNLIPVTLELGGKSPHIFFADVAAERDDFYDKALEGFTMFAPNQGEVCTCPSRALVQSASSFGPACSPTPNSSISTWSEPLPDRGPAYGRIHRSERLWR